MPPIDDALARGPVDAWAPSFYTEGTAAHARLYFARPPGHATVARLATRPVRDPLRPRRGRYGRSVAGPRHAAEPDRGHQARAAGPHCSLRGRGQGDRRTE